MDILDEQNENKKQKGGFRSFGKIFGINMLILIGYNILFRAMAGDDLRGEGYLGVAILLMLAVGIQVAVNLILMIFYFARKENEIGLSFLINMILVLIIGFSACWAGAMM